MSGPQAEGPIWLALNEGRDRGRAEVFDEWHNQLGALIRGDDVRIFGCRVRLEWIDPKPSVADVFAEEHKP